MQRVIGNQNIMHEYAWCIRGNDAGPLWYLEGRPFYRTRFTFAPAENKTLLTV